MSEHELSKTTAPCRLTGARTVWRDRDGEPLVAPLGGHFRRTIAGELVELAPYVGPIAERLLSFLPKPKGEAAPAPPAKKAPRR